MGGVFFRFCGCSLGGVWVSIFRFCGCGGVCLEYFQILRLRGGWGVMGAVYSDFLAAGRGRVVGEYFQILWLRERARGLWVSIFRFCGCGKEGGGMGVGVWG